MTDPDQEQALRLLASAIGRCVETLGPACAARLLGTIALDLTGDDHRSKTPEPSHQPDRHGRFLPR